MVTYGDSPASLPPLLHEGLSLAAAGFQVDSVHSEAAPPSADQHSPGFRSHTFRLRIRGTFRALKAGAPGTRAIAAVVKLLSYGEFIVKATVAAYRMRADLYVAHDVPALLPTLLAARLRGKPLVYRANEIFSETHAQVRFAWFWRGLDRLLVPSCDEVVTPEEHRSRIYKEEYGAKKEPLTVRNCPPYRLPVESTRLRDELRRRGVDFSIILLYRNDCRNNYYCAPNKLFEYMMMGLPVIAPSFPGIVPVVEGGNTGLCVDPAQPKQIAAAVNELARAPELRRRMKENGLRLTRERYNWETEFAPLLERYRGLLAPVAAGEVRPSTAP